LKERFFPRQHTYQQRQYHLFGREENGCIAATMTESNSGHISWILRRRHICKDLRKRWHAPTWWDGTSFQKQCHIRYCPQIRFHMNLSVSQNRI
jgi:hypothetical protein